jgi:asparagine synthase (glutamine-hydrolysing)
MMLTDQQRYLPDDLLAKVDRTSMAVSLEVRVPILDHRVVELSWHLPQHVKLRNGQGKWVLRQVLYRRVPRALVDRPKVGFSVPLGDWLRGPLRGWAEDRLEPSRLAELPWLDGKRVRDAWDGFLARRNNDHLEIWTILMFEAWRERWIS